MAEKKNTNVTKSTKNTNGADGLVYALKNKPVIATLVNEDDLDVILQSTANIVFVLKGDIFTVEEVVGRIQHAGKLVFVHFDMLDGIGKDRQGVRYLSERIGIDGIVTTKAAIIIEAKKLGLIAIHRLFVLDSVSLDNGMKMIRSSQPDAIEVLPGLVCARIMDRLQASSNIPVIAGGLLLDMKDLETALASGTIGISTSSKELWRWQDELFVKD